MNKTPLSYSEAAVLARLVGEDLLAQLPFMALKPKQVLEVGCGIGEHSKALKQHYPNAEVLAIDLSLPMLQQANHRDKTNGIIWINTDATCLPIANQSVDLIFANFFIAWQPDVDKLYQEWRRILRPNGLLIFNTFGPDTFKEYDSILQAEWIPRRVDMHDVGDMLLQQGFCDPVITTEYYTLSYKDQTQLIKELYESDLLLTIPPVDFLLPFSNEEKKWSMTFEVVTAHAFAPTIEMRQIREGGKTTTHIPLTILRDSLSKV